MCIKYHTVIYVVTTHHSIMAQLVMMAYLLLNVVTVKHYFHALVLGNTFRNHFYALVVRIT